MSYVRWSDTSDVYVYMNHGGTLICCDCLLDHPTERFHTFNDMLNHLQEHLAAGHLVPAYAFESLARGELR